MKRIPFKPGKVRLVAREPKPGELVLTRFDGSGITGTFRYEAKKFVPAYEPQGPEQKVTVVGTFDFPCPYQTEICRKAQR